MDSPNLTIDIIKSSSPLNNNHDPNHVLVDLSIPIHNRQTLGSFLNIQTNNSPQHPKRQRLIKIILYSLYTILFTISCIILLPIISCAAITVLPLLFISLIAIRLLQFVQHDQDHDFVQAIKLKRFILSTLCIEVILILPGVGLVLFPISKLVHGLNHTRVIGLPVPNWLGIICMLCGFYLLSFLCFVSVHTLLEYYKKGSMVVVEAISEIIDCLIIWWAKHEFSRHVPAFKHLEVVGLPIRHWIKVFICLLIGYNIITLLTHMIASSLPKYILSQVEVIVDPQQHIKHPNVIMGAFKALKLVFDQILGKHLDKHYLTYYFKGLNTSIDFMLSTLMVLLTWLLYFGIQLHLSKQKQAEVFFFGTWTFVCLLIFAFFWLIKTGFLLNWKVRVIYKRLNQKILENGKHLYFLGIIGINVGYCDIFKRDGDSKEQLRDYVEKIRMILLRNKEHDEHESTSYQQSMVDTKRFEGNNKDEKQYHATIEEVQRVLKMEDIFLEARNYLGKESYTSEITKKIDEFTSGKDKWNKLKKLLVISKKGNDQDIQSPKVDVENQNQNKFAKIYFLVFEFFHEFFKVEKNDRQGKTDGYSRDVNCNNDWNSFLSLINDVADFESKDLKDEDFEKYFHIWVVRAHSRCLILANTLNSAKEITSCLDTLLSWFIIISIFMAWLLLTKVATTSIIVGFGTTLALYTFLFGDTCKTIFQGLILIFVVHPFDVGDLCLIEDNLLEVKAIGVLVTTFSKVGLQEEITYPNSTLINIKISNYRTDIEWTDRVELNVRTFNRDDINNLKNKIKRYLDVNKEKFVAGYNFVAMTRSTIKDNNNVNFTKIQIEFRHNVKLKHTSTYFELIKEKRERQSEFLLDVQELLNEHRQKSGHKKLPENVLDDNANELEGDQTVAIIS